MTDSKPSQEIERKWLLSALPASAAGITPVVYERYFLASALGQEIRIQKKGDRFIYERKIEIPGVGRERAEERDITEAEFETFRKTASKAILRSRYDLAPGVAIQVYHGDYAGLIRYEVEFENAEAAQAFVPESWFGREITDSPLGRDARLLKLNPEEFRAEMTRE